MYRKNICRPSLNQTLENCVRLAEIEYDTRTGYIESVCAALIDGRFGPDPSSDLVRIKIHPASDVEMLFNALAEEAMMDYPAGFPPPLGSRRGEPASRTSNQRSGLASALMPPSSHPLANPVPNQGRGSPLNLLPAPSSLQLSVFAESEPQSKKSAKKILGHISSIKRSTRSLKTYDAVI